MQFNPIDVVFKADSLASSKTTAVVEYEPGVIWIATSGGGASCYRDCGSLWQTFNQADGLANPDIRSMIKSSVNELWFGTADGVSCYSPQTQQWQSFFVSDGLLNNQVWSMTEGAQGEIWMGTNGGGLSSYNPQTKVWGSYTTASSSLANDTVQALMVDSAGKLWVGTNGGLSCLDLTTNQWQNYTTSNGLPSDSLLSLAQDNTGTIWAGTDSGLAYLESGGTQWQNELIGSTPQSSYIKSLLVTADNTLWAGTLNGISQRNPQTQQWQTSNRNNGLSDNEVWGTCEDSLQRVWATTWGGGVNVYTPSDSSWSSFDAPTEFADTYALSVIPSGAQHMWIGTYGAVSRYNTGDGSWVTLSSANGLPNDNVQTLAEDLSGNLWIGTSGGLIQYQPVTQNWRLYTQADGLISDNVLSLFIDDQQVLWIGAAGGFCTYSIKQQQWATPAQPALPDASVYAIRISSNSSLCVATNQGLAIAPVNTDQWQVFQTDNSQLLDNQVYALATDDNDVLWIGTNSGVNQLNLTSDSWLSYTNANSTTASGEPALANEQTRALVLQNESALWVSFSNGSMSRFRLDSLQWDVMQGLPANDMGSLTFDQQGRLWAASQGGGVTWLFLDGSSAGFEQVFTGGSQAFAGQLWALNQTIAVGRPRSVAVNQIAEKLLQADIEIVGQQPLLTGFTDGSKNLQFWAGSSELGLSLSDQTLANVQVVSGLPSRHITCISSLSDGTAWVGTAAGFAGVTSVGYVSNVACYPATPAGPVDAITAISRNEAFIGYSFRQAIQFNDPALAKTRQDSVIYRRTSDGKMKPLEVAGVDQSTFAQSVIVDIAWSGITGLWVATNKGLFRSRDQKTLYAVTEARLQGASIKSLSLDTHGNVAVLLDSASSQLVIYYPPGNTAASFTEQDGLPAQATAVFVDASNTIWVSQGQYIYSSV